MFVDLHNRCLLRFLFYSFLQLYDSLLASLMVFSQDEEVPVQVIYFLEHIFLVLGTVPFRRIKSVDLSNMVLHLVQFGIEIRLEHERSSLRLHVLIFQLLLDLALVEGLESRVCLKFVEDAVNVILRRQSLHVVLYIIHFVITCFLPDFMVHFAQIVLQIELCSIKVLHLDEHLLELLDHVLLGQFALLVSRHLIFELFELL